MAAAPAPLVRVVRSGLEESVHLGDVAVCDAAGRLVASDGDPVQIRAVREVLRRARLAVGDLRTPPAWPSDPSSARRLARPAPLYHNCSGKHAGMLFASARRGWPLGTYRNRSHPLQRRVLRVVRLLAGEDDVAVGVDGCGVPVHGMTLRRVATMFARLSDPD